MESDRHGRDTSHAEAPERSEAPSPDESTQPDSEGLAANIVSAFQAVAEPVANVVGPMASALGTALEAAGQALSGELAGRIHRAISQEPLPNLYDVHPGARDASPREFGLRFVPVEEIRGTAVAGPAQRGSDFQPLRQYRGDNWQSRFQRIRMANEQLRPLPPIDLMKFGGEFWVLDGHNRVAAALQDNAAGLDAMVTELVPLDSQATERPTHLLSLFGEGQEMRAAAQGRKPAMGMRYAEQASTEAPEATSGVTDPGAAPK
jgi:hypothetical protein